jgi:hypothetical protein
MTPPRSFASVGAYVLIIAVAAAGFRSTEIQRQRDRSAADRIEAHDCVNAWSVRADIRDAIAVAAGAGAEALIDVAGQGRPATVAAYRAALASQIADARERIPDPACDLTAARRRLGR